MEISTQLGQPQTIKKLLDGILRNNQKVLGAVTAAMLMVEDSSQNYRPYVLDEDIDMRLDLNSKTNEKPSGNNNTVR
jgi:hypothetical protein